MFKNSNGVRAVIINDSFSISLYSCVIGVIDQQMYTRIS